jgi:hypothetical protein
MNSNWSELNLKDSAIPFLNLFSWIASTRNIKHTGNSARNDGCLIIVMIDIKPTSLTYRALGEVRSSVNTRLKHINDQNECSTTELILSSNGMDPIVNVVA